MAVTFENNLIEVINQLNHTAEAVLEECASEMESEVKRNTAVVTGQTKNSWQHMVLSDGLTAVIGSDYMNAVWEEFGTGEFALHGDGRKGGWSYQDHLGIWHYTNGKRPKRAFYNAYTTLKDKIIQHIQSKFGEL